MSATEQYKVWNEVLRDNVFVLCKTKMAEAITRRTLAGFGNATVNTRYQAHLIEKLQSDMDWVVKKIKNPESWKKEGTEMKFDAIVGNPPYQLMDGGAKASATPIYNLFVDVAKKVKPEILSMIMPARWYAGGKGLDKFREDMLKDERVHFLFDYANSADCFSGVNIAGGLCYFLWDKNYSGECVVANKGGRATKHILSRSLHEYPIFVRNNLAISIIKRCTEGLNLNQFMGKFEYFAIRNYFGIGSPERGVNQAKENNDVVLLSSDGKGYYSRKKVQDRKSIIDKYKTIITYAMSGGNKPSSEGDYQVISSLQVLMKNEVCTETFLVLGAFEDIAEANNLKQYMATRFARFLLLQALTSIHITRDSFIFVPLQDFTTQSDIDWSKPIPAIDAQLYKKYALTPDEISFIESMIKPME